MNELDGNFLGIEIGGTKLQLVIGRSDGWILRRWRFQVSKEAGGEGIRTQIASILPEILKGFAPARIAVGFGGPVDGTTGRIACSHQIHGWSGFDLRGWLQNASGLDAVVENDANVATLGEAVSGAGRGLSPVFYVTLGSGVGGGLVCGGNIYHGARPGEAEIGHIRLDGQGAILESKCSGWAVDRSIRLACSQHPNSKLASLVGANTAGEARFLGEAIKQGDVVAQGILEQVGKDLALGLSHVTHLFHPEVIVLGGGLSLLGEVLRSKVAVELRKLIMDVFLPGPEVKLSGLAEDSVPVGALILAGRPSPAG